MTNAAYFDAPQDRRRTRTEINDKNQRVDVKLFTVAGTPSVYYGDEQAFRGTKQERVGADDAIRPQFPSSPADLSPLGESTYRLHQELIGLRRRHPWLHRARTTTLHLTNMALLYEVRAGDHRLVTAMNLDDAPLEHDVASISEGVGRCGTARRERGDGCAARLGCPALTVRAVRPFRSTRRPRSSPTEHLTPSQIVMT